MQGKSFSDTAERLWFYPHAGGYVILRNTMLQIGVRLKQFFISLFRSVGVKGIQVFKRLHKHLFYRQAAHSLAIGHGVIQTVQVVVGYYVCECIFQCFYAFKGGNLWHKTFVIAYKLVFLGKIEGLFLAVLGKIIAHQSLYNETYLPADLSFLQKEFSFFKLFLSKQSGNNFLFRFANRNKVCYAIKQGFHRDKDKQWGHYVISRFVASVCHMRLLSTIICILFVVKASGQDIELLGRYGASFGAGGESIEFVGKDSFYFRGDYLRDPFHGKGRCEIRNNYLYLFFAKNNDKPEKEIRKPAIINRLNNNDSISRIQLTVLDNKDQLIYYATAYVETNRGVGVGAYTISAGKVTMEISNNAFPILIRTNANGFVTNGVTLDRSSNYEIKLYHLLESSLDEEINNGQIYVYEIDELSEDLILMRPQRSREKFREYTRYKTF